LKRLFSKKGEVVVDEVPEPLIEKRSALVKVAASILAQWSRIEQRRVIFGAWLMRLLFAGFFLLFASRLTSIMLTNVGNLMVASSLMKISVLGGWTEQNAPLIIEDTIVLPNNAVSTIKRLLNWALIIDRRNSMAYRAVGRIELVDRNYGAAILALSRALFYKPFDDISRWELGGAYERLGDYSMAILQWKRIGKKLSDRFAYQARYFAQIGEISQALTRLNAAIAISNESDIAYRTFGDIYLYVMGDSETAEVSYRSAVRLTPQSSTYHSLLAHSLLSQGKIVEAETELKTALLLDGENAFAHLLLGDVYRRGGRWGEAIDEFKTSLALDPANYWARLGLGDVSMRTGDSSSAIYQWCLILESAPDFRPAVDALEASGYDCPPNR